MLSLEPEAFSQVFCFGAVKCQTEVGIYKRKQESKKEHAFDQERDQEKKEKTITVKKKERKHALDQQVRFKKNR